MESWFIYPILAAFFFSTVNYLDKFIIEKISVNRGVGSLVLFSALAGIPVILILTFVLPNQILTIDFKNAILMILAGMFYLIGVIFYLYAMWEEEVSSVIPQLLLIPVITLLLGYLFLGETISILQLSGGILILSGALILTSNFKTTKGVKLKILLCILGASFFASLNQLIFKYGVLDDVSFWTALCWEHMGFILMAIIVFLFVPIWRNDFFWILKKHGWFAFSTNTTGEIINIFGNSLLHYGAILAPVGLISLVAEGIQPFFLLGIGIILTKLFPHIIKENIKRTKLVIKLIALTLMLGGLWMIG